MYRVRLASTPCRPDSESLAHVIRMDRICFPTDDATDLDAYWWLAYDPGSSVPVGFAGLSFIQMRDLYVGYLLRCGVEKPHRGNGLMGRLVAASIRHARRGMCQEILTYTVHDNCASINSLLRCKFKSYRPKDLYAGEDVCYWRLPLS